MFLTTSLHRRLCVLLLMACFATATIMAQYRVTATVIDPEGEPEEFCTYRIFAASDTVRPITGNVSDANGTIDAPLSAPGSYTMIVSAAMRQPLSVQFSVSDQARSADLGILNTAYDGEQLNEVTVSAQRPLVSKEIDRIGYEVSADPEASTSNLRDILRKVPLVTVDNDGTIKVNGSDNFKIYKNGRPNNAFTKNAKDIFAAIPASTIKKIEVITDPGAREDAESSGIILNIITSSTTSLTGVSGSVGLNWDSNTDYPNFNAFLMTQLDKLTLSASGGYYHYNKRTAEGKQTEATTFDATGDNSLFDARYDANGKGGWFNVEASLELDTLNLLTTALNGYVGRNGINFSGDYTMFRADGTPVYTFTNQSFYPTNGYTDIDFNLDYQRSTRRKGETITLSYRLSHTNQDQVQRNNYLNMVNAPFDYTGINSDFDLRFFEHTFQVDWGRPFGSHYKLDTGAKYILRSSHSTNHQDFLGTDLTSEDEFEHRYHIFGVYGDLRATYGKITARAGLRYEYSRLGAEFIRGTGDDFHSNLNDFVPNASIAWNASQSSMFKASYSRRIQRPGISYLNPAVTTRPTTVTFGNPNLESMALNNAVVNYSLIKRKFNLDLTATYSASNNGTGTLQWVDNNIIYSTYANLQHQRSVNLSVFFQWSITDKTQWMLNGSLGWNKYSIDTDTEHSKLSRFNGNFYTRVSQQLPWDLNLSLSAYYWSGFLFSPYSYYTSPLSAINYSLQLKRSFLRNKTLDVSITAANIGHSTRTNTTHNLNGGQTGRTDVTQYHGANIGIGITWRFGSLRAQVKKAANTINNDDLDGRKNK